MDINGLFTSDKHEEGARMPVEDEFGNQTDAVLYIVGIDSPTWRQITHDITKKMVFDDGETDDIDLRAYNLSKAVKGWEGLSDSDSDFEYSENNAFLLLKKAPYICTQIDSFISDRANFTKS